MFPLLLFPLPIVFLSYLFWLLVIGVEGYSCTWSSSITHTHTHTHTLGRIPLDEGSAYHRDLYLTTHNTYQGKTPMLPAGFEPPISASDLPQTYALDRAATGTGSLSTVGINLTLMNSLVTYRFTVRVILTKLKIRHYAIFYKGLHLLNARHTSFLTHSMNVRHTGHRSTFTQNSRKYSGHF